MKILIVHNSYLHHGGEDEVVKAEKQMLERCGHSVYLYWRENQEFHGLPLLKKFRFLFRDIVWSQKTYDDIRALIRQEKPDIVHLHNIFFFVSPSIYDACRDEQVPLIQTLHNYRFICPVGVFYRKGRVCEECLVKNRWCSIFHRCWKNSFLLTLLLNRVIDAVWKNKYLQEKVTRFIALSEFSKQKFVSFGFPEHKISIKPNFIDFDPGVESSRQEYVLFVGALRDYKGISTLLEAWKKLGEHLPLKIIGEGPLEAEIIRKTANENVEILGQKPLRETIRYIKNSLFVIIPSECYENFPRVIIEAFACGVPVLASNIGAMSELIQDEVNGMLFFYKDINDFVRKLKFMISNRALIAEMGEQARKLYEEHYTLEKNYQILNNIYERTIREYKEGPGATKGNNNVRGEALC